MLTILMTKKFPLNASTDHLVLGRVCSWSIRVPDDKRILLEFLEFDLENDALCYWDHLSVFAGEDMPLGKNDDSVLGVNQHKLSV